MLLVALVGCGGLPGGGAGDGDLVAFVPLGVADDDLAPHGPAAGELTSEEVAVADAVALLGAGRPTGDHDDLPAPDPDDRRFGFVLPGCQQQSARLVVDGARLDAELVDGGTHVDCAQAEYFLVVYDVPAADLPAEVELS